MHIAIYSTYICKQIKLIISHIHTIIINQFSEKREIALVKINLKINLWLLKTKIHKLDLKFFINTSNISRNLI